VSRSGPINIPITLSVQFLDAGDPFEPYSIENVRIYDVATGTPTPLATISPDAYGNGIYSVTWDALATSTSLTPGTYYDEWTWTAESGMLSTTQRYSFTLTYAIAEEEAAQSESTETLPETQSVACFSKPSWVHRPGITLVEDVGNGMGVNIAWEEARPADYTQQIHYNIYYATTRFDVLSAPKAVTTDRAGTINIPPSNVYYFAVKAAEFDTDWDITELTQISENIYQYPTSRTLLNNLPATQDGYYIYVDSVDDYPSNGELLIDQEIIRYGALDTINNAFVVDGYNRAITLTQVAEHEAGADVELWHGVEDGNTIIRMGTAAWFDVVPRNVDEIGQPNVDADGYRAANTDNITTDLSASDTSTADFPNYDYKGYHRPSIQATLSGECVSSYVGGEFDGGRGLFFQDRNLARLDAQLQVTGENVLLFKRKWTGKRCKCIGLRREHQRTRCSSCFGTGFSGGYDRFINTRAISESYSNSQGYIKARIYPYVDDVKLDVGQGLTSPVELNAWTIVYPAIKDRDVIIRYNEDGAEEFRYECLNVTRNRLLFGESGKQEFRMLRMDKTDVLYTLPVLTL